MKRYIRTIIGLLFIVVGLCFPAVLVFVLKTAPGHGAYLFSTLLCTLGGVAVVPEVVKEWLADAKDAKSILPKFKVGEE